MTRKYTEDEVVSVLQGLLGRPEVVDRRGDQTASDIVGSLIEFIYRSLNSDVDSVFSILNIHTAAQIKLCTEAISYLSELYELAPLATVKDTSLNAAELSQINADLRNASFAVGSQQDTIISEVIQRIASYVEESGGTRTPQHARNRGLELLLKSSGLAEIIQDKADFFPSIVEQYMNSRFEDTCKQRQLDRSINAASVLGGNTEDPNESRLALAVISSLLTQRSEPKRDIRAPKYAGAVDMLPGTRAELVGGTLPLIVIRDLYRESNDIDPLAEVTHTLGTEVSNNVFAAPYSRVPGLSANLSPMLFSRYDGGTLRTADGTIGPGPRVLSSHDLEVDGVLVSSLEGESTITGDLVPLGEHCAFLKTCVIPGSIRITLQSAHGSSFATPPMWGDGTDQAFDGMSLVVTDHLITDDGSGGLIDEGGNNWGYIDYSTGALIIASIGADILNTTDVNITYNYNPFLEGQSYIATIGSPSSTGAYQAWDTLSVWVTDELYTVKPEYVSNATALSNALQAVLPTAVEGSVLSVYGRRGGTSSRLAFPHRAEVDFNPDPFAPVFRRVPQDFNEALGLNLASFTESYGRDTPKSDIASYGDGTAEVTSGKLQVQDGLTVSFNGSQTKLFSSVEYVGVQVGDDIEITSPVNCHTKVVYATSQNLGVWPPVPAPIRESTEDNLDLSLPMSCKIRRDNLKIASVSDDAYVEMSVANEGLGFSGDAAAFTTKFALQENAELEGVVMLPGYVIKPGDVVIQNDGDITKPIGHVRSVDEDVVSVRIAGSGYDYPYRNVEIYSMGWSKFKTISSKVSASSANLARLIRDGDLLVKGASYLNSGSGQNAFYQAVLTLRDNIGELRNLYLDYDANVVNTANSLLTYFKGDKISVISDLLNNCRFVEIAEMTPATLSSQSSVEHIMEQTVDMLGGGVSTWDRVDGENLFADYLTDSADHILNAGMSNTFEDAD